MTEFTAHAITARMRQAWQQSVYAQIAVDEARARLTRILLEMAIVRGIIIVCDDPDFPIVGSHDYGCEMEA